MDYTLIIRQTEELVVTLPYEGLVKLFAAKGIKLTAMDNPEKLLDKRAPELNDLYDTELLIALGADFDREISGCTYYCFPTR